MSYESLEQKYEVNKFLGHFMNRVMINNTSEILGATT